MLYKYNMKVPFLNSKHILSLSHGPKHQLHVIKDTSLMGSNSTQENEKKGKILTIVELL